MPISSQEEKVIPRRHNWYLHYAFLSIVLAGGLFYFVSSPGEISTTYAKLRFQTGQDLAVRWFNASEGIFDLYEQHEHNDEVPILLHFGSLLPQPIGATSYEGENEHDLVWLKDDHVVRVDNNVVGIINPPTEPVTCVLFGESSLVEEHRLYVGDMVNIPLHE